MEPPQRTLRAAPQAAASAGAGGGAKGAPNPQAEAAKIRLHELLIEELEHGALEGLAPEQQRGAVIKAAREGEQVALAA